MYESVVVSKHVMYVLVVVQRQPTAGVQVRGHTSTSRPLASKINGPEPLPVHIVLAHFQVAIQRQVKQHARLFWPRCPSLSLYLCRL